MRLALVTTPPAPPADAGEAARGLLPHLAGMLEVEVFVERGREGGQLAGQATRAVDALVPREFDQILYELGDAAEHAFMLPLVRAVGGAVALRDWVLFDLALAARPELARGGWRGLRAALAEGGVAQARTWWRQRGQRDALARERFRLPLNRSVVRFADAFVVHSAHLAERIRADRNAPTPIGLVPRGADPQWSSDDRGTERERLGLPAGWRDAFVLTSFGALRTHKRLDVVLEALRLARRSRAELRLALIGAEPPGELDLRDLLRRLGLDDAVHLTGWLPEDEARRWLRAGDLGVQLRGPSSGRASGAILATLAAGRGVVASALDEQKELPDECVYKLHPGEGEAQRLAQKLVELHDAPSVRLAMEQAARDFVSNECRWERVAARYVEVLERFPRPRASRRSLWSLRLEKAAREGYARGRTGDGAGAG